MLSAVAPIVVILMLVSTSALAQTPSSAGPVVQSPGSRPVVTGGAPGISGDVSAIHGRPGGVDRIQDPYGTTGAAATFGRPAATEIVQDPSRARAATQTNPYRYGVMPR